MLRGGTYVSTDPSANAVTVMKGFGGCTLEDCTVWGSSVILGGELTLRHCTITGAIRMGTGARLRVEHTPLAEPPFVLNGALHETRRGDTLVYTAK